MTDNNKTQEYFNREAKDFDVSYKDASKLSDRIRKLSYFYNKKAIQGRIDALLSLIGDDIKGKTILEVGCGSGLYSIRLAQKGAFVTVNDFAPSMLKIAEENAREHNVILNYVPGDFLTLDLPSQFDYVFATGVIDYIPLTAQGAFVRHMKDLSQEYVIISFPKKGILHAFVRRIWLNISKRVEVNFFNEADIQVLAANNGLEEISRIDVGILWVIKFRRKNG